MSTDKVAPPREVLDALINNTIIPILKQLEEITRRRVFS